MAQGYSVTASHSDFRRLSRGLGRIVAKWLHEMELSGQDLADRIGSSRQYVSQILNGGSCSFKTIMKICDALGLELVITLRKKGEQSDE